MRGKSTAIVLTTAAVLLFSGATARAQTFTTLYNFTGSDGIEPLAGVIQDPSGNLYGTAYGGGNDRNYGVVYEMSADGTETVLHDFCSQHNCKDGSDPDGPVVRDKGGNIYGTTEFGGSYGLGTVFKVDTAGNETVLHSFKGGTDGCYPEQGLVLHTSGAMFGTALECGAGGYGTIFKVSDAGSFTVLHGFTWSKGAFPIYGRLTMDTSGDLFGVTEGGGASGDGALYKLSKNATFTLLYSFKGGTTDGCMPYGSVARDKSGNLYGTTDYCGSNNDGTIWKVSKRGKETILHNFAGGTSDGCIPVAGVTRDSKGNLYGVTSYCGVSDHGALYELSASGTLTLLHSFDGSDGDTPFGEVLRTTNGALFGTTSEGATYGAGTVWKYVP